MRDVKTVRGPHAVALALFGLVWFSCVWFGSWEFNPNNATRLFAAIAIVERGETRIDRYQSLTIDKAQFGEHFYMDKAPGMTLMALPVVWGFKAATGGDTRDYVIDVTNPKLGRFMAVRQRVAVALGVAILTAFASVLLLDLATGITGSPAAGTFAALGYAMGSIVWGWSTTLFGHAPVAALLLIATWAIWRGTSTVRDFGRWHYPVMAGAALGWAVVIEFPAALGGVAIGLWALWRAWGHPAAQRWRVLGVAVGVAVVTVLPLFAYNIAAFGTPFRLGYSGVVGFNGMQQGLFGLTYPKPDALFGILLGTRRGLLWCSPVILLGAWGLVQLIRDRVTRDLGVLCAMLVVIVVTVNASYVYWDGGASMGPRHAVPAIPFLAIGLARVWAQWSGRWARAGLMGLMAVSMLLNFAIASTDVFASEAYDNPVWDLTIRTMVPLGLFRTLPNDFWGWPGWRGILLYLVVALPALWVILRWTRDAEAKLSAS
ncbi:glycosyltransferase family 39 protein [Sphingomonas immobilis]|uniref:Glycosyltransferase RgtA/B/C/D-like domain-containing protein n=1 Tax=Sphingomonas immobilis TaxID=3063997 RepID=A0ABT8ZVV0_9SPHN|nr:hypothetical protein [Sphingomonas sp. CA1-15]MDO7841694.1 hypothetical protein [Sphingomonas sp. CA1-15]